MRHVTGDGLAVPAVKRLEENFLTRSPCRSVRNLRKLSEWESIE